MRPKKGSEPGHEATLSMKELLMISEKIFSGRRKRILKELSESCAFFFSPPVATSSRDTSYPYRPNSDILYLTGIEEPEVILVLRSISGRNQSILYLRDKNLAREIWEGPRLGVTAARRKIDVTEVRPLERFAADVSELCGAVPCVYSTLGIHAEREQLVFRIMRGADHPRFPAPHTLKDARLLTAPLRYVKDKPEIDLMKQACTVSATAFAHILQRLRKLPSERQISKDLEREFIMLGAERLGFESMVAVGTNCTNLHHAPSDRKPRNRELVLIDAGGSLNYYGADITRTAPVNGKFTPAQRTVYDIVEEAREEVVDAIRPGITIDHLQRIAARTLVKGLTSAKILRESPASILLSGRHQRYFMHRISHFIGLDTHDVAPYTHPKRDIAVPGTLIPFTPGTMLTVEPGLYFQKNDSSVPAEYRGIGIRIEDTILVTRGGSENLTSTLPTKADEIEKMVLS